MTDRDPEKANYLNNEQAIPRVKEELNIGKKNVETGKVTVKKEISEEDVNYNIDLQTEKVNIERFPRNMEVDEIPSVRKEGNKTIIPVIKEVMVKKYILVEEVHLEKSVENNTETISEKLREEKVTIQRDRANSGD